MENEGHNIR